MVKQYPIIKDNQVHHYCIATCVSSQEFKDNERIFFEYLQEKISTMPNKLLAIEGYALYVLKEKIETIFCNDNILIVEMKNFAGHVNGIKVIDPLYSSDFEALKKLIEEHERN